MAFRRPKPLTVMQWPKDDPAGMGALGDAFLESMRVKNFAEKTILLWERNLRFFFEWCEPRGLTRPVQITRPIIERYQRHIFYYQQKNGRPLSAKTQSLRLQSIKMFYRWLTRSNYIPSNPAADIDLPKLEKKLPRQVLTISEVERVINVPDVNTPLGMRDRAILETLYSTGMRRGELLRLKLFDMNQETGVVFIRLGKGKKDRMIPIGERASAWLRKYIMEGRPKLVMEPDDGTIFLAYNGTPLSDGSLGEVVRNILIESEVGKGGSCHLFRHTMATHMLEGGADIRFIQQMLGHAQLTTTEIYTQVSIRKLKEIHSATHPGAKLERKKENPEHSETSEDRLATEEELFSSLTAEEKEEKKSGVAPDGEPQP